ncbi:MAG: hypothetical protein AAFX92_02980 [Pseudomonadota bacterium]
MAHPRKPARKRRRLGLAELKIDRLGRYGDGLAVRQGQEVYIPFALPGERVEAELEEDRDRLRATVLKVVSPSSDRVAPVCEHFGACGGCQMQHMSDPAYLAWKRGLVVEPLHHAGVEPGRIDDVVAVRQGTRRRATVAARRTAKGVVLGFNAFRSVRIVTIGQCPVSRPEIGGLFTPLRDLLSRLPIGDRTVDVTVSLLDDGLDVVLTGVEEPDLAQLELLADFAECHDLARLSWRPMPRDRAEPIAHRRCGVLRMGEALVVLPPGGFCQASAEGEAALADLVLDAAGSSGPVIDLFCGVGTFGLRLASLGFQVTGFDGDALAVAAFKAAARHLGGGENTEAFVRNLFRDPLSPAELNAFRAAVFDPPRAGAQAQAAELATSDVPVVIGVSCDPMTFARDARLLVDGGYRLDRVTPVDQFVWSRHVELVGVFRR